MTRRERQASMGRAVVADTHARGRAARRALRAEARAAQAAMAAASYREPGLALPEPVGRFRKWGRWGPGGDWGPISAPVPWHTTSTARIGLALPFLAARPDAIKGPIIGLETSSGQYFTYDTWGSLGRGALAPTSPGVVVFGLMNTGKSFCVKLVMLRMMMNGRHVVVSSDPKGEWAPLARAAGGQVVAVGPGSGNCVNPLDEGTRPAAMGAGEWRRLVMSRRALALASICATLRPHKPLDEWERAALNCANIAIADGLIGPTIAAVAAWLRDPPPDAAAECGPEAPRALATILGLLVKGHMAGMFDGPSTVALDPAAPMVVVDTSRLAGAEPEVRAIAQAATSAWIDATLRSMDGRWRCVVSEEGWDELRNPHQAQAMDERLRLSGHWRVSNWLIFHELADIGQFGAAGSEHRNQVKGIITKSATKILFRQSAEAMAVIREFVAPTATEARALTTLPNGVGMWHIGGQTPVSVVAMAGPSMYQLINTDAGRWG